MRIFGIPEQAAEDTNQIVIDLAKKVNINITNNDISVSHRLGPVRRSDSETISHSPRAIIVKFVRRDVKVAIMRNKKYLKNKKSKDLKDGEHNVYINEDLTPLRMRMKNALEREGVSDLWTMNGNIRFMYKLHGRPTKIQVETPEDLITKLGWNFSRLNLLRLTGDTSQFTSMQTKLNTADQ